MKHTRVMKALALASLLFCGSATLFSCGEGEIGSDHVLQSTDRNIVRIQVDQSTIPDHIFVGRLDEAGIQLVITYDDDSQDRISLTTAMIPSTYRGLLEKEGVVEIEILYRGVTISVTLNIVKEYYTVDFYARTTSDSYQKIDSQNVAYGAGAVAPTISEYFYTELYHYTFTQWSGDFSNVTKNLSIYALYDEIAYYTVNFYNGNNLLISSQKVDEGDDAIEPSEELVAMEGYDFIGWDRTYTNVRSNLSVYALYVDVDVESIDSQAVIYTVPVTL